MNDTNEKQEKMCSRKTRYKTEMAAHAGIGKIRFKFEDRSNSYMRAYKCPYCSGWHITSREFDEYAIKMRLLVESI